MPMRPADLRRLRASRRRRPPSPLRPSPPCAPSRGREGASRRPGAQLPRRPPPRPFPRVPRATAAKSRGSRDGAQRPFRGRLCLREAAVRATVDFGAVRPGVRCILAAFAPGSGRLARRSGPRGASGADRDGETKAAAPPRRERRPGAWRRRGEVYPSPASASAITRAALPFGATVATRTHRNA